SRAECNAAYSPLPRGERGESKRSRAIVGATQASRAGLAKTAGAGSGNGSTGHGSCAEEIAWRDPGPAQTKATGMSKNRPVVRPAAGCLIAWGGVATAQAAQPTPQDMLAFRPKQDAVPISTPAPAELSSCKVELVNGPGAYSGWLLRDGRGLPLRKFGASKG